VEDRDKRGHDAGDDVSLIWIRSLVRRRAALDTSAGPIDVTERIVRHIER
jgi:hypothetical protein